MSAATDPTPAAAEQLAAELGTAAPSSSSSPAPAKRSRSGSRRPKASSSSGEPDRDPSPTRGRPPMRRKRAERVTELHTLAGMALTLQNPTAGAALMRQAAAIGDAWAAWAETSPRIARALDAGMDGAGAVTVLLAYLPVVLAAVARPGTTTRPAGAGAAADPAADDAGGLVDFASLVTFLAAEDAAGAGG